MVDHCKDCRFWQKDYGTFTATGWTGMDRDHGWCRVEPTTIAMAGDAQACRHFVRAD
jgi:hypothetical protein